MDEGPSECSTNVYAYNSKKNATGNDHLIPPVDTQVNIFCVTISAGVRWISSLCDVLVRGCVHSMPNV